MISRYRFRLSEATVFKALVSSIFCRNQNELLIQALKNLLKVENVWLTFNGRLALWLALKALDKPGTEIIMPGYICPVVPKTVINAGYKVHFVDSDIANLSIDINSFKCAVNEKTSAVIVVYIGGIPTDISEIKRICQQKKIVLIEDCAQSFLSKINGKYVGSESDFAVFSFGVGKEVNTGGGFLTSKDKWKTNIERIYADFINPPIRHSLKRFLQMYLYKVISLSPFSYKYIVSLIDEKVIESKESPIQYNFFNDKFSSYMGMIQLKKIHKNLEKRRKIVALWKQHLKLIPNIRFPAYDEKSEPSFLRMLFFMNKNRVASFIQFVNNNGIDCVRKNEPFPEQYIESYGYTSEKLTNVKRINETIVALPANEFITTKEFENMISIVKKYFTNILD